MEMYYGHSTRGDITLINDEWKKYQVILHTIVAIPSLNSNGSFPLARKSNNNFVYQMYQMLLIFNRAFMSFPFRRSIIFDHAETFDRVKKNKSVTSQ